MSESQSKVNKTYIHAAIMLFFMIGAHFIPAPAPLTPMGVQIIGLFIGMIYGWCTCGMLWPSLLGILMIGLTDCYANPQAAIGAVLTHQTVLQMLIAFILLAYIEGTGLMNVIANWLVTRKFAAGKPWVFLTFFFFMLVLIAGVFNSVILMIIAFNFMLALLDDMGYTKEDILPTYILLGIGYSAGVMCVWPPMLPHSLMGHALITTSLGGVVASNLQYFMIMDVPLLLSLIIYLLVGKFIVRPDTTKFVQGTEAMMKKIENEEKVPMTQEQKNGAIFLSIFILGLLLPSILPKTWAPIALLNNMGLVGIVVAELVVLMIIQTKEGKPLADTADLMKKIDWTTIFLVGSIMIVATALTSEGTGVSALMASVVVPIMNKTSLPVFVAAVTIILCIFSQFSMNMVLQWIFAPILAPVMLAAGYNPMIAIIVVYMGTQLAFLAPSGSMMAAMIFAKSDWVKASHIYKIAVPWIVLSVIMFIACALIIPDMVYPM